MVPILRIFDIEKAKEFSLGNLVLHLSEHHGDGTPGTIIYVETHEVRELHAELAAKDYGFLRPGISEDEIGTSIHLLDPFGNTQRVNQRPDA